jgi:hypothetical protein
LKGNRIAELFLKTTSTQFAVSSGPVRQPSPLRASGGRPPDSAGLPKPQAYAPSILFPRAGEVPSRAGGRGKRRIFFCEIFLLQISQQNQILDPSEQGSKDLHFSLCLGLHAALGEPFRAEKNFTCYLPESPGKP